MVRVLRAAGAKTHVTDKSGKTPIAVAAGRYEAYKNWLDAERVVVNVRTLYREFAADESRPEVLMLFAEMARYKAGRL